MASLETTNAKTSAEWDEAGEAIKTLSRAVLLNLKIVLESAVSLTESLGEEILGVIDFDSAKMDAAVWYARGVLEGIIEDSRAFTEGGAFAKLAEAFIAHPPSTSVPPESQRRLQELYAELKKHHSSDPGKTGMS